MGSAAGGAYSAPPNTLAVFKGPTSKEWKGKEKDEKRKGRNGEGEREERGCLLFS